MKKKDQGSIITKLFTADPIGSPSKRKKIYVNTANRQMHERLTDSFGGSFTKILTCNVDGWVCAVKELDSTMSECPDLRENFEHEISLLESLPYHKNIVR